MKEEWRDIPGYTRYQASTDGRVRSKDHYYNHSRAKNPVFKKGRVLKTPTGSHGYKSVNLCENGSKLWSVHVLILETFIGEKQGKMVTNHKNGIKTDNSLSNLEWVTYSGNLIHALDTGLNRNRKINSNMAFVIKRLLHYGERPSVVSKELNISKNIVHDISRGKTWKRIR